MSGQSIKRTAFLHLILLAGFCRSAEAQHTITASAGAGGTVSPSGAVPVAHESDITFTITPDPGYTVKDIVTAGVSVGGATSFTYYLVRNSYTMTVDFIQQADGVPETIYVDGSLPSDCTNGEYSIANRDNSGGDGDAYTSITEACDVAGPGDTVLIRAGTYRKAQGSERDILWPKHSGTAANPITFKPYNNEVVVIGDDPSGSWPGDLWTSISRGAISMRNVHYIHIEGLTVRKVGGWLFARNCSNVTVNNCWFEDAMFGNKAGFRITECDNWKITNNTFLRSAFDGMLLVESDYNLIENNTFDTAAHSVMALRSASYNVIRNNTFDNYHSEKIVEVFDQKCDTRDSANPSYIPVPGYNGTQHNLFEGNFFGFTTEVDYVGMGARCSAMQFSGQSTIIRNNVYCNPVNVSNPDTSYLSSGGTSGGVAIVMRWGGSWTGWDDSRQKILGEGHEAGYVSHNRIYNNTFYGYDGSKLTVPVDNSMGSTPNPPPMKNVQDYYNYPFTDPYEFEDNIFKNNNFSEGVIHAYINWSWVTQNQGKGVQTFISGRVNETYFEGNNFFTSGSSPDQLILDRITYPYQDPKTPAFFNANHPMWSGNIQADPLFVDPGNEDFRLQPTSPMIDAGAYLARTTSAGSGTIVQVDDAGYFYDGYGIGGEQGDSIKFESGQTAQIVDIDYAAGNNLITLNRSVSWSNGEGVSLHYDGAAPDVGAHEYIQGPSLSVSSSTGGSVTAPGEGYFAYGSTTNVAIAAVPAQHYFFVSWSGTAVAAGKVADTNLASTRVTVDASYTLVANFDTNFHTLTVSSTGGGSVTSPGEGTYLYDNVNVVPVNITATPSANNNFANWTGTAVSAGKVADPTSASTTVTPDADYTLVANFSIVQHNLTTSSNLGGSVTTPGEGTYAYDHGASAAVSASASANYHFVNWTGTAVSAGKVSNANASSTTVTMDAAYTIQANFAIDQHTLTTSSTSGGSVSSPGEGSFAYDSGTGVPIQAVASSSYVFVNWTGTAASAGKVANPNAAGTTVTVDAPYTLRANFGQPDGVAPTIGNLSPASGSIQAPLDSLIILHVTDAGIGVKASSVVIELDGSVIYTGDVPSYNSAGGTCRRAGGPADYTYAYQSNALLDFDDTKTVTVNASDIGGVAMARQSYSFRTEMRSFGQNKQVNSGLGLQNMSNRGAATVSDSSGNIWAVWHAGPAGSRDIYLGRQAAGASTFDTSIQLTTNSADQVNPDIACVGNTLYVVWQDKSRGDWDIWGATSANWSTQYRIADSDPNEHYNQVNPALAVDGQSPNHTYVVWQDDRAGNQDIYIAESSNAFVTNSITQVTSHASDQTSPAVAVNSSNAVYVLWTDARNTANGTDIYGASSGSPWTNVPVISKAADQSNPQIAVESAGSVIHWVWVDQSSGNGDIYYDYTTGLPGGPLTGGNLVDDTVGAVQLAPTIAVTGTGAGLKVFVSWQDSRNVSGGTGDLDLYMVQTNSGSGTNVFVGDGGTNSDQTEPALGVDQNGYPYIVWTDNRSTNDGIYFAGSTCMQPTPLLSGVVTASSGGTVGNSDVDSINDVDDVSIAVPAAASPYDVTVSITKIENPHSYALPLLNEYEFSPSGLQFNTPVTITIPYTVSSASGTPTAYWYDSATGTLSQQGMSNIQTIVLTPTLHALRFTTTHLTPYTVVLGSSTSSSTVGSSGGGGGGGCSLSNSPGGAGILEYFLPYMLLAAVMLGLRLRDRTTNAQARQLVDR